MTKRGATRRRPSATLAVMMCPVCHADDTRVVDSRGADDGLAIRRRRYCGQCERRFTTFERVEEPPVVVTKRGGLREPFCRDKIVGGLLSASKGRPLESDLFETLAGSIEDAARLEGGEVTSEWVGLAVLDRLRDVDQVAALRFASVYKGFTGVADFEREMSLIKCDSPEVV
ncbi:MAG: transcriptional regulator NrdR [Acidimicrobiales bacterium]